jgi:hypothetical protein
MVPIQPATYSPQPNPVPAPQPQPAPQPAPAPQPQPAPQPAPAPQPQPAPAPQPGKGIFSTAISITVVHSFVYILLNEVVTNLGRLIDIPFESPESPLLFSFYGFKL